MAFWWKKWVQSWLESSDWAGVSHSKVSSFGCVLIIRRIFSRAIKAMSRFKAILQPEEMPLEIVVFTSVLAGEAKTRFLSWLSTFSMTVVMYSFSSCPTSTWIPSALASRHWCSIALSFKACFSSWKTLLEEIMSLGVVSYNINFLIPTVYFNVILTCSL